MKTLFSFSILALLLVIGCNDDNAVRPIPYNRPEGKVTLYSQSGFVESDQSGVLVYVEDTSLSATTDVNGNWKLPGLKEGYHTFVFTKQGCGTYKERVIIGENTTGATPYYDKVELYEIPSFSITKFEKYDTSKFFPLTFSVQLKNLKGNNVGLFFLVSTDSTLLATSNPKPLQCNLYSYTVVALSHSEIDTVVEAKSHGINVGIGHRVFIRAYAYPVLSGNTWGNYLEYMEGDAIIRPYFSGAKSSLISTIIK